MTRARRHLAGWYESTFLPFYERWAPAAIVLCLIVATAAIGGTYLNQRSQAHERDVREQTTAALLSCFDRYADNSAAVSKKVREAQVSADAAESRADHAAALRDAAFQEVILLILEPDASETEGLRVFNALRNTNAVLVKQRAALVIARERLEKVRANHPIPDPPSEFCKVP